MAVRRPREEKLKFRYLLCCKAYTAEQVREGLNICWSNWKTYKSPEEAYLAFDKVFGGAPTSSYVIWLVLDGEEPLYQLGTACEFEPVA